MATILLEGFDGYGPNYGTTSPPLATLMAQGGWNLYTPYSAYALTSGLNGYGGYAAVIGAQSAIPGTGLVKTLPQSYSRLIGGFRFSSTLSLTSGCVFQDTNTPQCSILINATTGLITFCEGDNGTVLGVSNAAVANNTEHYLEFDIIFGAGSLGGWTISLDGVQIMNGTGQTKQSANSSANVFIFRAESSGSSGSLTVDDFYLFDSTTAFNNAALLSNPIVLTQFPVADVQTEFPNLGNVVGYTYANTTNTYGLNANSLYLLPITPQVNCSVSAVVLGLVSGSSNTANTTGVVYSDLAGAPHTLLATGTQVTGFFSGTNLILPLGTPLNLSAGVQYWIGVINDSGMNLAEFNGSDLHGQEIANTYSGGPPATAPTLSKNQPSLFLYAACTGATTNWETLALNPPLGDVSSVSSASVGVSDLFAFPALPTNVNEVYAVAVSGYARLTYAGVHTFDLEAKSSGTGGNGNTTNIAPTLSYEFYDSNFDTDPGTGGAWTPTTASNAVYGMVIAS